MNKSFIKASECAEIIPQIIRLIFDNQKANYLSRSFIENRFLLVHFYLSGMLFVLHNTSASNTGYIVGARMYLWQWREAKSPETKRPENDRSFQNVGTF